MAKYTTKFLFRRNWADDSDNEYENDQLMDGYFDGNCQPEKKPDGNCEPPKKAPEKKCPEPPKPKPVAKKCRPCKPQPRRLKSACKRPAKRAKPLACNKVAKRKCKVAKRKSKCPTSQPRSGNPFLIFYLSMLSKTCGKRAADVAREAGKLWCCLDVKSKEMYQKMAQVERMRRQRRNKRHRKRKCSTNE